MEQARGAQAPVEHVLFLASVSDRALYSIKLPLHRDWGITQLVRYE